MRHFIILLLLLLFTSAGYDGFNSTYLPKIHDINLCMQDENDGAHFIYYRNDSHISHWYEWWYFNVKNDDKALLLYFFTFGDLNNPFHSSIGIFAAFFNGNEKVESITTYPFINYTLDYKNFNISIAGNKAYESGNKYIIHYKAKKMEIKLKMEGIGKPFGGKATKLSKWQWMAWYVAIPYGNASVEIKTGSKEYKFHGLAYHDHNWGIAKITSLKWDWGEFCNGREAIIYGMAYGKGGLYFVNRSMVRKYNVSISYEKWVVINGFLKPSLIHIYSYDGKIDLHVKMKKFYIIGIRKFGKPYLMGELYGKFYGSNFNATGFYEHHASITI